MLLGNKRLMEERQVSFDAVKDLDARLAELSDSGATPLLLAVNGRLVGMLAVADTIRPETAGVVKELRQLGLRVIMLSGDNRRTAEAIAKSAGIDEVIADVLPDGKEKVISELQAAGLRVGMIGDGINDAPLRWPVPMSAWLWATASTLPWKPGTSSFSAATPVRARACGAW